MTEYIIERVLMLSAIGAVATLILLAFFFFTNKLFGNKWRYYTCIAFLFVFLIPLSINPSQTEELHREKNTVVFKVLLNDETETCEKALSDEKEKSPLFSEAIYRKAFYVWLAGGIFYLVVTLLSYSMFLRRAYKNSSEFDCTESLYVQSIEKLTLLKTSAVTSPVLTGIIKPVLFLPDRELSEADLKNIMLHECTHITRHDIAIKWLCVIAKSVHWFNPVVFLLCKRLGAECEISCDIEATSSLDKAQRSRYCATILSLISSKNKSLSPTLCMGDTKKNLERRFRAIMEENKKSKKIAIISAAATVILLLCAFTASAIIGGSAEKKIEPIAVLTKDDTAETEKRSFEFDTTEIHKQGAKISAAFDKEKHPAVDYIIAKGTAVTSPVDGTVTKAEYAPDNGNHIEITLHDGTSKVLFAHLEKMFVSEGDEINIGDSIGTIGATGRATGPHLHVEYFENGEVKNPVEIFIIEENGEISAIYSRPKLLPTEE